MPTKQEMMAFFRRFRDARESEFEEPSEEARQAALAAASALTQAARNGPLGDQQVGASFNGSKVPSPPAGTASSPPSLARLQHIQSCPKNQSPNQFIPSRAMLPPQRPDVAGRVTLVLDLDETLVHSSFKNNERFDVHLPLLVNGMGTEVFVKLRPNLSTFLDFCAQKFEVVIFTASLGVYADPLMDFIDKEGKLGTLRLFREHCTMVNTGHIKDLSLLGRDLDRVVIIDNSPAAYYFQPRNALPISSWFDDPNDMQLLAHMQVLAKLATCSSVYDVLDSYNSTHFIPGQT